ESMGRSGYARATLAPEQGMEAAVPELRQPARLTMADMGGMHGMDHGGMDMASSVGDMNGSAGMAGMDHSTMQGMDHSAMNMPEGGPTDPFYADGSGLVPTAANGGKFLSYADLKAQKPLYEEREPTREIELRLTGNMERYTWSINGIKYEDADPIRLKYGERVRFKFVNTTMMTHPMHLHGMWSILDVGAGEWNPVKHTISVQPGTTVYMETEVDAPGQWAFHCHLSYHAAAGMFRKVIVEGGPDTTQAKADVVAETGGDA
ncbi:MAG: multicopper oxidase domain-containing protein, partial [Marinobacter sp.]|nr:multicopper oxidase domain-containing protein [Marinobacter sp.]